MKWMAIGICSCMVQVVMMIKFKCSNGAASVFHGDKVVEWDWELIIISLDPDMETRSCWQVIPSRNELTLNAKWSPAIAKDHSSLEEEDPDLEYCRVKIPRSRHNSLSSRVQRRGFELGLLLIAPTGNSLGEWVRWGNIDRFH